MVNNQQCNHKKVILDFLKFMKMDSPLMEIMIMMNF